MCRKPLWVETSTKQLPIGLQAREVPCSRQVIEVHFKIYSQTWECNEWVERSDRWRYRVGRLGSGHTPVNDLQMFSNGLRRKRGRPLVYVHIKSIRPRQKMLQIVPRRASGHDMQNIASLSSLRLSPTTKPLQIWIQQGHACRCGRGQLLKMEWDPTSSAMDTYLDTLSLSWTKTTNYHG